MTDPITAGYPFNPATGEEWLDHYYRRSKELEAACERWAKQVDDLETERDRLRDLLGQIPRIVQSLRYASPEIMKLHLERLLELFQEADNG